MRTATVRLKHKKKGRIITVDQHDYATDLGKNKYRAYSLIGEELGDDVTAVEVKGAEIETQKEETETTKEEIDNFLDSAGGDDTSTKPESEAQKPKTTGRTSKRSPRS